MSPRQRRVAMLIAATLIMAFSLVLAQAQDNATLQVSGSGLAAPVIEQIAEQAGVQLNVTVSGSGAGISSFCAGETDIALSTRPLTADEEAACNANQVAFSEFLLGHNILSIVTNEADALPQCLTTAELDSIFAPSSDAADWAAVGGDTYNLPLTFVLPPEDSVAYALLDSLVNGVGLRVSGVTAADREAILDAVRSTPGAVGVVTAAAEADAGVRAVSLDTGISGCVAPTSENVERRLYTAANRLFAYVNSAKLDAAQAILQAAFGESGISALTVADFVAPSATAIAQDQSILTDALTGRQFSRDVTAFTIPAAVAGEVKIAGSTESDDYISALTGMFVQEYPTIAITYTPQGEVSGIRQFCNGEIDIVSVERPLTDEELATCSQNNVTPESFYFGSHASVVLINAEADFAQCLTTAEVAKVWGSTVEGTTTNWSSIREGFPDLPITVFTPTTGSLYRDLLVQHSGSDQTVAPRVDGQENADTAYRTAATANVAGATTFMSWQEYQDLPASERDRIQLLAVDAGNGCVEPSAATIGDQSYALAAPVTLVVNRLAMGRQDVQSLLWYASSDEHYSLITTSGLVGLSFDALGAQRDLLEPLFFDAAAEAAEAVLRQVEATEEAPAAESTPEATPESTVEGNSGG